MYAVRMLSKCRNQNVTEILIVFSRAYKYRSVCSVFGYKLEHYINIPFQKEIYICTMHVLRKCPQIIQKCLVYVYKICEH